VIVGAIERLCYNDDSVHRAARTLLAPAAWSYRAVVAARNALYDRGVLEARAPAIPVLSLGNLSVGGTGKTPLAAWAAARLRVGGARPAVVLRGYGGDETLVHQRLNPDVIVVAEADRVRGVQLARERGADVAILDDAFQHRRIGRTADWVLVAAEQWRDGPRLLPAGPLREPASVLRRADLLIVTRKSAPHEVAEEVADRLFGYLQNRSNVVICHLAPYALVDAVTTQREPLSWLNDRDVTAVAAVGAPDAFFSQLAANGANLDPKPFPDHHAFDARDVSRIVRSGERRGAVICTLKDAVKLAPLWPRAGPTLWYVSQRAVVERGSAALDTSLGAILAARAGVSSTAGSAGSSTSGHGDRSSTAD
jgi:tetraacyldisaccharide 4'-kinase